MIRIFLTGYMGAGKTTLGKAFAREMNVPFIDLDWYIEERFHKSIRELFTERGEASFRELERNMLHEVGEFEDVVVSTGGGTPCFFDNMEYMKRLRADGVSGCTPRYSVPPAPGGEAATPHPARQDGRRFAHLHCGGAG